MTRNPNICPNCHEHVSAFAAGCALCGAALDPQRAQGRLTASQCLYAAWLSRPRLLPRLAVKRLA
jgi:predicted amidophosphoribosyltransferase